MKKFPNIKCSQGSLLGGLQDNSVATSQGRANFPSEHDKRKVPWNDLPCYTNWFVQCLHVVRTISRNSQPMDFICPTYNDWGE